MSRQTFTSFISNVTRHPSWPIPISHISARLSSYATFMVNNLTQAYIMALPPSSGHLQHRLDLHFCHSLPYSLYNHFRHAKSPNSYHGPSFDPLRYKKATTKSRRFTPKACKYRLAPMTDMAQTYWYWRSHTY